MSRAIEQAGVHCAMASKTLTLVNALTHEHIITRSQAAEKLDAMLARGADLSEAVPTLSARFWDFDPKLQPTILSILAKATGHPDFASLVQDVVTSLNSKDRERRRQAADILLAWVDYKGLNRNREKVAPQQAYVALAQAFRHKDNVLRKRVCEDFYSSAWQAPDFSAVLQILLHAYDATDEETKVRVDQALQYAAECGLDIRPALPHLKRRLPPRPSKAALAALIAYYVHQNDAPRALALFREHDGGSYVCQQVGGSVRPIHGIAGLAILRAGLEHSEAFARYAAAKGLQYFAEAGADIAAAVASLGGLLGDAAPIKIALTQVGKQAARTLAAAGKKGSARGEVLRIIKGAELSEDRTTVDNVSLARAIMAGKTS